MTTVTSITLAFLTLLLCAWLDLFVAATICCTILAAYLPTYVDGSEYTAEGRHWDWFCRLSVWKYWGKSFPMSFRFQHQLDNKRQVIFAAFPHGVASIHHLSVVTDCCGWFSSGQHHDRRDLGASVVFKIPIYRELLLWLGLVDAGRKTAQAVLASGRSLYVLPGGVIEQVQTEEGKHNIFAARKGFIRLAVEFGVDIVPVYCFGENDLFSTSNFLLEIRKWVCKKFYIGLPIAYRTFGSVPFVFPFCGPKKIPLTICFGSPVKVIQMSPRDPEFETEVERTHKKFLVHLQLLFDECKSECGYRDAVLHFLT